MQSIRLMFLGFITVASVTPVVAQDVKPETQKTLETAIPEGVRLLEAKEYQTFVKNFASPADLKRITEEMSLEEFAKTFGERKAQRLLQVLKEIKDAKPDLDDTGTKATFTLKERIDGGKSIEFIKIEKYWYLQN